ncbi:hypothetical protein Golob_024052 [Gossypium lobatum]|uniref:Uncharacterized protein n=1 Tax=Gossypium lobatum TaxID=34289 RepID=A0A7J8NGR2_9ROSI|nr:hypothetical protein [Gossypium lobatum]
MEGILISKLPILNASTFAYYKECMRAFTKYIEDNTSRVVLTRQEQIVVVVNGEFIPISKCTTCCEAWAIIETTHGGTTSVKQSKAPDVNDHAWEFDNVR